MNNKGEFFKKCKICDCEFQDTNFFTRHLKKHDIKIEEYILKYVFDNNPPTCKCGCGTLMKFKQDAKYLPNAYFREYAKNHAPREATSEETKQKIREGQQKTWTEKYGVDHISKLDWINEKKSISMKEKEGYTPRKEVERFTSSERFLQEKTSCTICSKVFSNMGEFTQHLKTFHNLTKKEYFVDHVRKDNPPLCNCGCGEKTLFSDKRELKPNDYHEYYIKGHSKRGQVENEIVTKFRIEQTKKSLQEKYGVDNPMQVEGSLEKIRETKRERYGDANYTNVEKQLKTKKILYNIKTRQETLFERQEKKRLKREAKEISRLKELEYKENKAYERYIAKIDREYRKQKEYNPLKIVDNTPIECKICNQMNTIHGLRSHLRHKHNGYNIEKYVLEFSEFRPSEIAWNDLLEKSSIRCLICNEKFVTNTGLSDHVRRVHNITKESYIIDYIYEGVHPTCKCKKNCGQKVNLILSGNVDENGERIYARDFIHGHENFQKEVSEYTRGVLSRNAINRIKNQGKFSKPELVFKEFLESNDIEYIHQYPLSGYKLVDFYIVDIEATVEIDGVYFHPDKKEEIDFTQLRSAVSDYIKNPHVTYRINEYDVYKIKSLDDLSKYHKQYQSKIPPNQVVISKEYISKFLNGAKYILQDKSKLITKFFRLYYSNYNFSNINSKIVSKFKNDDTLHKTILYMLGFNDTNTVQDLTFNNIIESLNHIN